MISTLTKKMKYNWRLIRLCAIVQFSLMAVVGGFAVISGLTRIDTDTPQSSVEGITVVIASILTFPMAQMFWLFEWLHDWPLLWYLSRLILLMANSVLWAVCLNLLLAQTLWRKLRPPSVQPRHCTGRHLSGLFCKLVRLCRPHRR